MPIKGLSEKRRLPRLGKIHLGIKAKNDKGVEYPKMVDYFVCPPEVQELFGEKPKELRIIIPLEDEEKWASQYYRCYSRTRGLICKGDGETAMRMLDIQTGALADRDSKNVEMKEVPCQGRECPDYKVKCKEVMNLQFLLPEVSGMGVWQIDTSSVNSIRNINGAAELIRAVYGRVAMIPLLLTIEQIEVTSPADGKKKKVSVLNLRTKATMIDLMQASLKPPAQLIAGLGEEEAITPAEVLDLPNGDAERPDLITPEWEAPELEPKKPERDPSTIRTLNDLYKACNEDFGLQPTEVISDLGVSSQSDISDTPADCYRKIVAVR